MIAVSVPSARVGLSTASVYPETTSAAFEMASRLGYDGIEIMVWTDPVSQDADALSKEMVRNRVVRFYTERRQTDRLQALME